MEGFGDMHVFLVLFAFVVVGVSSALDVGFTQPASAAEECIGDDCPKPDPDTGGRDCETKKEPTVG